MTIYEIFSMTAALLSGGLGLLGFLRDRRSLVHCTFALGMALFAAEEVFRFLSFRSIASTDVYHLESLRSVVSAFFPGVWLLFSLSFSRTNYRKYLMRWRWVVVISFVLPLALVTLLGEQFFVGSPVMREPSGWVLPLGWPGYAFYTAALIASLLIIMHLEITFRASSGTIRWQMKFMVLGLMGIFAVRIFTASQTILFRSLDSSIEVFGTIALILSNTLIVYSLVRSRLVKVDIYLSETMLYRSFTFLIAGIYLLLVGILAKVLTYLNGQHPFFLEALFIFIVLMGLTVILLSEELRQQIRRFIYAHFQRPRYDYRKEWTRFTQQTASILDSKELCGAVAKMVSETFGVSSASLWLVNESKENLLFAGSTSLSQAEGRMFESEASGAGLLRVMKMRKTAVDFEGSDLKGTGELKQDDLDLFRQARIRYAVPLSAGNEFLGILTLSARVTGDPFFLEDFDLLKTIADQAGRSISNIKMSERLGQAKQMEAFQTMSAFFVHDLKNLASRLSMTMQNLPHHYGNAEFRNDAIRAIGASLDKINTMCGGLSLLRQSIVLQLASTDVNSLIRSTLGTLDCCKVPIVQKLNPLPEVCVDPDQVQKVITNLILNAADAINNGGEINVSTTQKEGRILISVSDSGTGMSKEFIEKSLFRPFKTTKKQGLGIGLFHSKMIIEAHRGRIEVDSEEGKGTTFRVMLPINKRG